MLKVCLNKCVNVFQTEIMFNKKKKKNPLGILEILDHFTIISNTSGIEWQLASKLANDIYIYLIL